MSQYLPNPKLASFASILEMVLLVESLNKLYSKLENHRQRRQPSEALLASLQAFKTDVSGFINQLRLDCKPVTGMVSFSWVRQCFHLLSLTNKAFAKLAVDIDYRMEEWKADSAEEYLSYSLSLLDLLNSVTSSLSQLRHARLSLSHALSLVASSSSSGIERLKAVKFKTLSKDLKQYRSKEAEKERPCRDKEWVICHALMQVKIIEFWVCSVVLAALSGDVTPCMEMRKSSDAMLSKTSLINLDTVVYQLGRDKVIVLKEVRELSEEAAGLAASTAHGRSSDTVEKMHIKLKMFEELLDGFGKEVDCLFSEVLTARNELLGGIRHWKQ